MGKNGRGYAGIFIRSRRASESMLLGLSNALGSKKYIISNVCVYMCVSFINLYYYKFIFVLFMYKVIYYIYS